ncbi:conserved hypothetical protein, partial [Ricinus communis]
FLERGLQAGGAAAHPLVQFVVERAQILFRPHLAAHVARAAAVAADSARGVAPGPAGQRHDAHPAVLLPPVDHHVAETAELSGEQRQILMPLRARPAHREQRGQREAAQRPRTVRGIDDDAVAIAFPEPVGGRLGEVAQPGTLALEFGNLLVQLVAQPLGVQRVIAQRGRRRGTTPGQRLQFGDQRGDFAGFDQKAVGAELVGQFLVAPVGEGGGVEGEGRGGQLRMGTYRAAKAVAIEFGHQDVGHDEVGRLRLGQVQRRPAVGRGAHRMTARFQRGAEHQAR